MINSQQKDYFTLYEATAFPSDTELILLNGTSTEYLIECNSCTTTLDTFLNDSL